MTRAEFKEVLARLDDIDAQLESDPPMLEPNDAFDIVTRLDRIEEDLRLIQRGAIAAVLLTWGIIFIAMIVVAHFGK